MLNLTIFQSKITQLLPNIRMVCEEPLSKHTSFKIGGPAEIMAFPASRAELNDLLKTSALLDCDPVILGAGTNILAPDEGLRGLVICLKDGLRELYRINDTDIYVDCGVSMTKAAMFAASLGLSGMEFAHGIPGSIGGGVYMNAGAYGGEIADICKYVDIMDIDGREYRKRADQMDFGYRKSCVEDSGSIVLGAAFSLKNDSVDSIKSRMQELQQRRRTSQPLDLPSAGSAFKRPVGGFAAALIDQSGLKGYRVGGAAVSEKHAGFVVNLGGATASDVKKLLEDVRRIVLDRTGIALEPEVRIL